MIVRRLAWMVGIVLVLSTCTSCQTATLDADGDGVITEAEFESAAFNYLCGTSDETAVPGDTEVPGSDDAGTSDDGSMNDTETTSDISADAN